MAFELDFCDVFTVKLSDMPIPVTFMIELFLAEGAVVNEFGRMNLKS